LFASASSSEPSVSVVSVAPIVVALSSVLSVISELVLVSFDAASVLMEDGSIAGALEGASSDSSIARPETTVSKASKTKGMIKSPILTNAMKGFGSHGSSVS
jgi:hypothetical protein